MPEYIVDLWLDGYDTEEQMEKACDEFIYEQLNFTASSVRVKKSDYSALLARHNALVEAVKKYFKSECLEILKREARAEVDRLIANERGDE